MSEQVVRWFPDSDEDVPGIELHRRTKRQWHVVSSTGGYAFTADDFAHDARLRAEHWLDVCGPDYHLELHEDEYWISDSRTVSRQVVLGGALVAVET